MNRNPKPTLLWFAVSFCLFAASAFADDWPQFLGIDRDGTSNETSLMRTWPASGPAVVWSTKVGEGMSGCAVVDSKVVTVGQDAINQYAICLNVTDGRELWRTPLSAHYQNGQGNGPRSTPTIVGDSAYVYTGDGVLARLNLSDGVAIWKFNVPEALGGKVAEYGLSCSPLVADDCVIVAMDTDGKQSFGPMVCVSATDGKPKWKSVASTDTSREQPGYSSPVLMRIDGKDYVVSVNGSRLTGIELKTGHTAWSESFETDYACNTATPLIIDANQIFVSAGENHGCMLLQIKFNQGDEDATVNELWSSLGPKSVMRNEWQTSIRDGDFLYGFDNQGSAGSITNLCCINLRTGKLQWIVRRFGKGNMISADGKLWMSNMDGEMVVANMDATKYIELGRKKVTDTTRQAPSLSNGFLFFRGKGSVVCVDIRSE